MNKVISFIIAVCCAFAISSCGSTDKMGDDIFKTPEPPEPDTTEKADAPVDTVDSEEEDEGEKEEKPEKTKKPTKKKQETVTLLEKTNGSITENGDPEKYSITLEESGMITINLKASEIEELKVQLLDDDGQNVLEETPSWNSSSKQLAYKKELELTSGTYEIVISEYYGGYGEFDISVDFVSAGESFPETQGGSNNNIADSNEIETDQVYWGQIAYNDDSDNYIFELEEAGSIELNFKAQKIEYSDISIYDMDGQDVWEKEVSWNSTSKQISYKEIINLTAGEYYFAVDKDSQRCGDYEFSLDFTSADESFVEEQNGSDNAFDDANEIKLNKEYTGQIAVNDDIDNYLFTLDSSKGFELNFSSKELEDVKVCIYDEDGQSVWEKSAGVNSSSKEIALKEDVDLESGDYYLSITKYYDSCGSYKFKIKD